MSEKILALLITTLDDLGVRDEVGAETKRNYLKEALQYLVLNFIYHHPRYSEWIMYGGSALRICYGLDRMSVDLDFEVSHPISAGFLEELKKEILEHFADHYGAGADFLTIKVTAGRGLLLKFHVGKELSFDQPSQQVHVKIDLNEFTFPKKASERIPINRFQFSFVINTYNMSTLMASKIAAIFLRENRGVGKAVYSEKGRDIYDLLWYMGKKIVPDLDYLAAKKAIDVKDVRALFNRLTVQINKVSDANLKQDLFPLFLDSSYIQNWLKNWKESYLRLQEGYNINTVTALDSIVIRQHPLSGNYTFTYFYRTEEEKWVRISYSISDYWIDFREGDLPHKVNESVIKLIETEASVPLSDKLNIYTTLFFEKTEAYLKKTNRIVLGDSIETKLIRMTADKLDQKEQILLNKSAFLTCELDDLLK